jgi:outer membrane lipoprotein SlyB
MNNKNLVSRLKQNGAIHPLMATAAVAVIVVSLIGVAAITGILPNSHSTNGPDASMVGTAPVASNMTPGNQVIPSTTATNHAATSVHRQPASPTATSHYTQSEVKVAKTPTICTSCGRVESVVAIQEAARPSGLGVAAGAVVGGLLGNQIGNGNGRTLATVAGAVAGGYGGNEVEKRTRTTSSYSVHVRMEDGNLRTFPQSSEDGWRVGDRVRVVNGSLTSRG